VRLFGRLVVAAADAVGLAAAARRERAVARRAPHWTLAYDVHYPPADHHVVPFVRLHAVASLLIGLHAALGSDEFLDVPDGAAQDGVDPLVLLDCKNGLLLLRQRSLDRREPANATDGATSALLSGDEDGDGARRVRPCPGTRRRSRAPEPSPPPAEGVMDVVEAAVDLAADAVDAADAACKCLPWWLAPWAARGFAFSASLDPLIAAAALNLAACMHCARRVRRGGAHDSTCSTASEAGASIGSASGGVSGGPLRGLRVYDPCCGSGTVLMAALAQGAVAVAGSDLRPDFVEGARNNLRGMGMDAGVTTLFEHDATTAVPEERLPPRTPGGEDGGEASAWCDVVVSNPPWGKNLGERETGGPIVLSLCRQFRNVVMVLLINKHTRATLETSELCDVHKVVKLGGVEAVLLTT
jgi:16S rRNA G966 N2-methylase RsmD